ncbi:MAG: O-antigen ligase family protein [Lachnospiraceae bacterium]|nr:O-antigen ligase family protein [Lachnospiraceae bacterium]
MNLKELMQHAFHDTEHVRRNTIIQIVIATLAFILLCRVWPYGVIQRHTESVQQAYSHANEMQGETFTHADKKLQTVRFTQGHIYQIMLYLDCNDSYDANEDYVLFRLYDDGFSCIYEETKGFGLIEKRGGFLATPNMDVDAGRDYYYEVIVPEEAVGSLQLPVADRTRLAQQENTILYVDGIYRDDISLVADFDYTKELTIFHIIGYDLLILIMAVLCYVGILWCLYRFDEYLEIAVYYGKRVLTVFVIFTAVGFFFFAVVMNGFGGEVADRVVYAIAVVVAVIWFFIAVWMPKEEKRKSSLATSNQISFIWRNYIQTVSFALLFYALCLYVNADREYIHLVNTRWMLIFLGIALLAVYKGRELWNLFSGIWLLLSVAGAILYCHGFVEQEELYLAKLAAGVTVIWGLVVIHTIRFAKKDFWKTVHWPFFAVWLVFVVFMYNNRFEKVWPLVATLPFVILLVMNMSAAAKSRLLKNFTNGIILNFGLVMLFCLMHRPYHYWMRYRYNGMFHTVACTGMYLALVSGAVLGKLYGKWTTGKKLLQAGKTELFLLSMVVANVLLTMSRTALLTLFVNAIAVVIMAAIAYKKVIRQILAEGILLGAAIIIGFPLMYTTIRVVPAVVNDPIRYEIEPQERHYMIFEGDTIDSDKYMTIERYFNLFFGRFQSEEAKNVQEENMLLAYIGQESLPIPYPSVENAQENAESSSDVSNGRFDIYKEYIQNFELTGHESMILEGKDYAHAHNSYIQVAYDFGLIAGVAFLILCAITLWRSMVLAYCYGKNYNIYFVPFSLIIVFGFISLTEWAFHPCIPVGFAFLLMQMVLMQKPWSPKDKIRNAEGNTQAE